uniref:Uncharacterized protein n=1 Tax=Arion vulgaris TaxID=1028688 RepID=A0A0B7BJM8_9EUPU
METARSFSSSTLTMKEPDSNLPGYREGVSHSEYSSHRRRSTNVPGFYNTTRMNAGLGHNFNNVKRSLLNKCLLLCPAFAFQYCSVLTSVYSIVNLHILKIPDELTSIHLIIAACLSLGLTIVFQKCVQQLFGEEKQLMKLLIAFAVYLSFGTILVLSANLERIYTTEVFLQNVTENGTKVTRLLVSSDDQLVTQPNVFPDKSYEGEVYQGHNIMSTSGSTHEENADELKIDKVLNDSVIATNPVPLSSQIMAFIGYIIMASSLSCGHYLLSSSAMSLSHSDDHDSINTIETVVAAAGACAVSLLGAVEMSTNWYTSHDSCHRLIGQIFILLCIGFVLLISCTTCSVLTLCWDIIMETFQHRNWEENVFIASDRRPTRTAQEMFDECALLLGHQASMSYTDDNLSPRNLPTENVEDISNSITQSETAIDDSAHSHQIDVIRRNIYQLPVTARESSLTRSNLLVIKTQTKTCLVLLLMFLLSGTLVSMEYNSSIYLSYTVPGSDDHSYGHGYRKSTRFGSAGTFITYLVFIAISQLCTSFLQQLGWRRPAIICTLVVTVLTLALAISNEVGLYFSAACFLGGLRVVVYGLPQVVSASTQIVGSPINTHSHALIENLTTVMWCMTPLSLGVTSAMFSPLNDVAGFHGISVYYSAVSALLSCVILSLLLK